MEDREDVESMRASTFRGFAREEPLPRRSRRPLRVSYVNHRNKGHRVGPGGRTPDMVTKFTNCRVLRDGELHTEDLWVRGGRVIDPASRFWQAATSKEYDCDEIVDCGGGIVCSGFIDIQINGAFGVDFSNPSLTKADVQRVARGLTAHGVTAFCPTVVTSGKELYDRVLRVLHPSESLGRFFAKKDGDLDMLPLGIACGVDESVPEGASNIGVHLEGPFIHRNKKGAHDIRFVRDPSEGFATVEEVYGRDLGAARIVTLAPELPGAMDAIRGLVQRGVVVSMGHSTASVHQGDRGFVAGANLITHLFNAMGAFHHRDPGLIGLLGRQSGLESSDRLQAEDDEEEELRQSSTMAPAAKRRAVLDSAGSTHYARPSASLLDSAGSTHYARPSASLVPPISNVSSISATTSPVLAPLPPPEIADGDARPFYSIIVDGVHAHPYSVSMARATHPDGLILITDAIQALGLPPGRHKLATLEVDIRDPRFPAHDDDDAPPPQKMGAPAEALSVRSSVSVKDDYKGLHAVLAGTQTLAGAVVPMDKCVRNLRRFTKCTKAQALSAATEKPAQLLGMTDIRGTLKPGARADIVLLNDDLYPQQTYVHGQLVWQHPLCTDQEEDLQEKN